MDKSTLITTLKQHLPDDTEYNNRWRIDIPDGWVDIVANLHDKIMEICPNYPLKQVKEKFGGLRFYVGPMSAELLYQVDYLIDKAEKLSACTCEYCGKEGHLSRINNWLHTMCQWCFDERAKDAEDFSFDCRSIIENRLNPTN